MMIGNRNRRIEHVKKTASPKKKQDRFSHPKYTYEQIAKALEVGHGMVSYAAKALGCNRLTIYNWMDKHPELRKIIDGERERLLDVAENSLFKAAEKGEAWAVCFTLKTVGKHRGYVERRELVGPNGNAIPVEQKDMAKAHDKIAKELGRIADRLKV